MSRYIKDPNNSKKQIPGTPPYQAFDRTITPAQCKIAKTPHYILVNTTLTDSVGFFFGLSQSFADNKNSEGNFDLAESIATVGSGALSGSSNYNTMLTDATAGTTLHLNPLAWSGSAADSGKISFVYRGGPDGLGRP
tara:strand:+ start:237 stop:647 length:411 start_codon:yes stop_codon:yes gene_type:complete